MEGHVPTPRLNPALFPSSSGNELASVNERKRFGRGAALDIDRFVLSAVDKDHLVRFRLIRTRVGVVMPVSASGISKITTFKAQ